MWGCDVSGPNDADAGCDLVRAPRELMEPMVRASSSFAGLPKSLPSKVTMVSAAIVSSLGSACSAAMAAALARLSARQA